MMRVPSLPHRFLGLPLLCVALGFLTACGGGNPSTTALSEASTAAQVSGVVMYPPAAGTVMLRASTGSQTANLVSFPIATSGLYTITLPVPAQLSAAGDLSALSFLPDPSLLDLQGISCPTLPSGSNSAARFAVVTGGTFQQNGQAVGELAPAVQAVGGVTALGITTTLRQYAYADQDTQITGELACTVTSQNAAGQTSTSPASVSVNYALKRGWNLLTIQATQQISETSSPSMTVAASAQTSLDGVQWRYVPLN